MADKSSQVVLGALSRAMADPGGLPLLGGKAGAALFPATAAGKLAAQRCQDEGYLRPMVVDEMPAGEPRRGRTDVWTITDKGLSYLLEQVSPRQVLEDFLRALEARQGQAAELLDAARGMQQSLDLLRSRVEQVLPQVPHVTFPDRSVDPRPLAALFAAFCNGVAAPVAPAAPKNVASVADLDGLIARHLEKWQESGSSEDMPLPELFRRVTADMPSLTIGTFHDALRRMHDAERLYLHPWTGPLYVVPEPMVALLVGHLVAYYASARNG